jgi:hypothetical protein
MRQFLSKRIRVRDAVPLLVLALVLFAFVSRPAPPLALMVPARDAAYSPGATATQNGEDAEVAHPALRRGSLPSAVAVATLPPVPLQTNVVTMQDVIDLIEAKSLTYWYHGTAPRVVDSGNITPEHRASPAFTSCTDLTWGSQVGEAWPICQEFLRSCNLAYSFGVGLNYDFDRDMVERCREVHSFDPTVRLRAAHERTKPDGVRFHYAGLRGELNPGLNKQIMLAEDPDLFDSLFGWMRRLNHTVVDMFKFDCEGCEHRALAYLAQGGSARRGGAD